MAKCRKSRIICYAKNVENQAIFVEGFWPEFYARGRFMKYPMSEKKNCKKNWVKKVKKIGHKKIWFKTYLGQKEFCPKKMLVHTT